MAEELCDPLPDIHELFSYYNHVYFEGKLGACTVTWSSVRMSLAAGACKFSGGGGCEIRLSEPVLKLRTAADLKKTLLHEMIHAYLFSVTGNKDHDDHGPCFQRLMTSINQFVQDDEQRPENGYNISVCHNFEDDMYVDQVHHWKCEKCGDFVKRSRNEDPSASDCSRDGTSVPGGESCPAPICHCHMHETTCGGAYQKTAEPAGSIGKHKLHSKIKEEHGTLASGSASTVGKKHSAIGGSAGTSKRAMAKNSSLDNYFSACEKGSDSRHGSDSPDESLEWDGGLSNKAIRLSNTKWAPKGSEEETEILRFKRRRQPARVWNQEPHVPTKEVATQSPMKGVVSKKRQRVQGMQTAEKPEREPTVILAWKGWCMFEDEEDGEMIEALINKRDERRMLERCKKRRLQEHDKEPGRLCVFGSEVANGEVNMDTGHILNDAREGGMAQLLPSLEQLQMDPTNFSALEESAVVDPLPAVVVTATPEDGVKTSDKSVVQPSFCTKISMEEKCHGPSRRKSLCRGDRSSGERHMEELIINLDDEDEGREATKPGLVSAQATTVVDIEIDSMKGSNSTDNPNEPIVNLPSMNRSRGECYRGGEETALGNEGNGVCEEQAESTGELTNVANQRGKQKVIEISDEEEDSKRASVEQQAISTLDTIHSLNDDCNADGGRATTTSGIAMSNVCFESELGSGDLKHFGPFEDHKFGLGAVESASPHQPQRPISAEELKVRKHDRTYRRQKMQLSRPIAGDDSGGEVRRPVANANDSGSIGERGSLEQHEGKKVGLNAAQSCPVCGKILPVGISNAELNSHIDQCLAKM